MMLMSFRVSTSTFIHRCTYVRIYVCPSCFASPLALFQSQSPRRFDLEFIYEQDLLRHPQPTPERPPFSTFVFNSTVAAATRTLPPGQIGWQWRRRRNTFSDLINESVYYLRVLIPR